MSFDLSSLRFIRRITNLFRRARAVNGQGLPLAALLPVVGSVLGLVALTLSISFFSALPANAAINRELSYQAKLLDSSGLPVVDGSYSVQFSLYNAAVAGTRLWTASGTVSVPTPIQVSVVNGLFTVYLGDSTFQGQNPLDDSIDWNSPNLYLGVTINADSEMSPRRQLTATPYAFNANQVQGMSPSSSAFGAASVFAINQTSNTAATGTRTALEVRSMGTSDGNDFLIRAINDLGSAVFTVNRQGSVTSTGLFAAVGGVSTTNLLVNGQAPCLANGSNCPAGNATPTLQQVTTQGNSTTNAIQFGGGTSTGNFVVSSTLVGFATTTQSPYVVEANANLPFTTVIGGGDVNLGQTGGLYVTGTTYLGGLSFLRHLEATDARLSNATATQLVFTSASGSNLNINTLLTASGVDINGGAIDGTAIGNSVASTGIFTNATSSNLTVINDATVQGLIVSNSATIPWLNYGTATGTSLISNSLEVDGPANLYGDIRLGDTFADAVQIFGRLEYALLPGTSGVYDIGASTSTWLNVYAGGAFDVNGTQYTATQLTKASGNYTFSIAGGFLLPASDLSVSLGSASQRFNGVFGSVTSTNATTTNLFVTNQIGMEISSASQLSLASSTFINTGVNPDPREVLLDGDYMYVLDPSNRTLMIYNISDPAAPSSTASLTFSLGFQLGLSLYGNKLIISDDSSEGIRVVDVSDKTHPVLVSSTDTISAYRSALSGTRVYSVSGSNLFVGNLEEGRVTRQSVNAASSNLRSVAVEEPYVFAVDSGSNSLRVFDASNPRLAVTQVAQLTGLNAPTDLAVRGPYAYVMNSSANTISIVDISNPLGPRLVNTASLSGGVTVYRSVRISGNSLFAIAGNSLDIFDITSSTNPVLVKNIASPTGFAPFGLDVQGSVLAFSNGDYVSLYRLPSLKASSGDFGSLRIGRSYTEDEAIFLGGAQFQAGLQVGRAGLKSQGVVTAPLLSAYSFENATSVNTLVFGGINGCNAHPFASKYLATNCSASTVDSLVIWDISRPAAPSVVTTTSYQVGNDIRVFGNYLKSGNSLFDVTNPTQPVRISTTAGSGIVSGGFLYGNQIYRITDPTNPVLLNTPTLGSGSSFQLQNDILYTASSSNIYTWNVANPYQPRLLGTYNATAAVGDMVVSGRYLYIIRGSGNIDVVDAADPTNLSFVSTFVVSSGNPSNLVVRDGFIYFTNYLNMAQGFQILDARTPSAVRLVKTVATASGSGPYGIELYDRYAYVGLLNGFQIIDLGGLDVQAGRISQLSSQDIDVAGDVDVNGRINTLGLNVGSQGLSSVGAMNVWTSSTSATVSMINAGTGATNTYWGLYANTLLAGNNANATGSNNYSAIISYDASAKSGLCLDSTTSTATCLTTTGVSIYADDAINASAFDLAERYRATSSTQPGDVLILDSAATSTVKTSTGIAYDPLLIGIASTRPGFLLGDAGDVQVALAGRVPTKVTAMNGAIQVGDPLTSSPIPGYAMKATKPGMMVGYALENASATGTMEVFVHVGYQASQTLTTDGLNALLNDTLVIAATSTATMTNQAVDSWGVTFRGSAWDGSQAMATGFTLQTDVLNATSSRFAVLNASSSQIFTLDQAGNALIGGDLVLGGKFFPSRKGGGTQTDKYIFLDDTLGPGTSTYMATNADGWQANDSYDFAERYYSPDVLDTGDLVTMSQTGRLHVQRTWEPGQTMMGIVSTRPAFVAGAPSTSTYPIALAGRVPTKVSGQNGLVKLGDPLTASSLPGVAVKATTPGPIVGYALENATSTDITKIEVFVNPGWWGMKEPQVVTSTQTIIERVTSVPAPEQRVTREGFAAIEIGQQQVRVEFASVLTFPKITVLPYSQIRGNWWLSDVSDHGFTFHLEQVQDLDVMISWMAQSISGAQPVYYSDGTHGQLDDVSGLLVTGSRNRAVVTSTVETVTSAPIQTSTSTESVSPVLVEPTPSSTSVLPGEGESTSTEPVLTSSEGV